MANTGSAVGNGSGYAARQDRYASASGIVEWLHTIAFLQHLMRMVDGRLLVILERSPIHRRAAVKEYVSEIGANKIHLEELPSYAPDLNPTEWMWNHLKHVEMRNLVCLDLEQLYMELHLAIGRLRQKPHVLKSFFKSAGLVL